MTMHATTQCSMGLESFSRNFAEKNSEKKVELIIIK